MRLFCWHLMARTVKVEIDKRSILKTESNLWIEMKNPKLKRPKYRLALEKKKKRQTLATILT